MKNSKSRSDNSKFKIQNSKMANGHWPLAINSKIKIQKSKFKI